MCRSLAPTPTLIVRASMERCVPAPTSRLPGRLCQCIATNSNSRGKLVETLALQLTVGCAPKMPFTEQRRGIAGVVQHLGHGDFGCWKSEGRSFDPVEAVQINELDWQKPS